MRPDKRKWNECRREKWKIMIKGNRRVAMISIRAEVRVRGRRRKGKGE